MLLNYYQCCEFNISLLKFKKWQNAMKYTLYMHL